ncbi:uncharacterized protein BDW47DRAFT_109021 [Aspergillus candidus]|uniref:Uncharacterized protein n=1 Tax=Aspergillus candidus TaxID=41067 RepID=A0A2I2F6G4_ASPCN|nr:hypothetical protein BDW47DRAFT_109021 [Aspergillus candidus]PLB36232.1 hypothetical protein BDW47DRAFT_109021 [Aspergillus candidus]
MLRFFATHDEKISTSSSLGVSPSTFANEKFGGISNTEPAFFPLFGEGRPVLPARAWCDSTPVSGIRNIGAPFPSGKKPPGRVGAEIVCAESYIDSAHDTLVQYAACCFFPFSSSLWKVGGGRMVSFDSDYSGGMALHLFFS